MPLQLNLSTALWHGVPEVYVVLGSRLCCHAGHKLAACLPAFGQSCLHGAEQML